MRGHHRTRRASPSTLRKINSGPAPHRFGRHYHLATLCLSLLVMTCGNGDRPRPELPDARQKADLTDSGTDLRDRGTDLTDSGTDLADAGTDLADGGTDLWDVGIDLHDAGTDLMDGGTDLPDAGTDLVDEPEVCTPSCEGKECGSDGCGGPCGVCTKQQHECVEGICVCQPACEDKECGGDGCLGYCGECGELQECIDFQCVCQSHHHADCCGEAQLCWFDSCGVMEEVAADCPHGCEEGQCPSCLPTCVGEQCEPDSCAGFCAICMEGNQCLGGECHCAETPTLLWDAVAGGDEMDRIFALTATPDGGYLLAGQVNSYGAGHGDAWLLKYDDDGALVWEQTYGGSESDSAGGVVTMPDGGFAFAGGTSSFGEGLSDLWLVRTDMDGNKLWEKNYGTLQTETARALAYVPGQGFLIAAITHASEESMQQLWLVKTDDQGEKTWENVAGSGDGDEAFDIVPLADGGFAIAGRKMTGANGWDLLAARYDSSGEQLWATTFGGELEDDGRAIVALPDGFAVYGSTESKDPGMWDALLVRLDSDGNLLWDVAFGGNNGDIGRGLKALPDGGLLLAGQTYTYGNGDAWLIRTDGDGNKVWEVSFGGPGKDVFCKVLATADGNFVAGGFSASYGNGSDHAYLVKIDSVSCQ